MMILLISASSLQLFAQTGKIPEGSVQIFPERIYLHTDKDFYLAGEIIWFKIYQVDGKYHRPVRLSKLAYV